MDKKNIEKNKYKILLVLFLISFLSSTILTINEIRPSPLICDVTEGCHVVAESPYAKTLGIENAYLGFAFFLVLTTITFLQIKNPTKRKKNLIHLGAFVGAIWAIYSFYLMEFVIQAYCKYCTTLDISSLLALIVILFFRK